jgi:PAS domain S-box-containing protein
MSPPDDRSKPDRPTESVWSPKPGRSSGSDERAGTPSSVFDRSRLRALREYQILDTEPEPAFDRITKLAARLFEVPSALINFVDEDRQWFKSTIGFEEGQTRLDVSFCVYTIEEGEQVVVEDLTEDERFADNPYVTERGLRFYAGAPLISPDGHRLGTLCVLDTEPRSPSDKDLELLSDLAEMVVDELELRKQARERRRAERLQEMQSTFFEFIATGASLGDVLEELCLLTEEQLTTKQFGEKAVSILQVEEGKLRHAAAPTLPDRYTEAIDGLELGPSAGTCGTAAFEDEVIFTDDIREDERWAGYRDLADEVGLRSCWSVPIRSTGGEVLGAFGIYGRKPVDSPEAVPSERERELVRRMAHVASVALERDRREKALRRSEERFRTVVENAQPMVFMLDEDGTVLLSEGEDLRALGVEPEEVTGKSVFALFEGQPAVLEGVNRALQGKNVEDEVEVGDLVFDAWYSPIYDEDGNVDGCIGMAVDVTERREMEKDLREQKARLQVAQRIAHLGYWHRDLRTGVLEWSDETRRIFGWPDEKEVTYEAFMEAVHPDDRERLTEAQEKALAGEEQIDLEYRIHRPSGEERVVRERGGLLRTEDEEPIALMGAVQDVTEEVRRREEIRQAKEQAEEAGRIKSALLSNMNHEFRTPLTSIISFAELIRDNPDVAGRFVDRILGGGKRLLYTLNTVMEFAELEGEGLSVRRSPCQVRSIIRSVVNDFRQRAREKGVDLTVETPDEVGTVRLDEHLVERILTHLLHNAVKFTNDGSVTVTIRRRLLRGGPDAVELIVADTGVGIEPSFLPRVFEEFAQASSGYDRTHEGNGLGLTVTKPIVDRMGGEIGIDSELGEGTRVTVRIPTPDAAAE